MSSLILEAEPREDMGKGASRRLRRLENKIPAILYGGDKKPLPILLSLPKVLKTLEQESIYSSIFDLDIKGKKEQVILKALQRHPYKPIIMHMDLQRVSHTDVLVRNVPIHFVNEQISKGVKAGGVVNHIMNQVEIRCQAKNLPEFIEVDLSDIEMDDVIHLADLKLPKGVQLTIDLSDNSHNLPVVSIHAAKVAQVEEEVPTTSETQIEEPEEKEESES